MVGEDGFGDLIAHAHDWIQRSHGLLEDHGDAGSAQMAELVGRERREIGGLGVATLEANVAGHSCYGRKQAHDGQRGDGFA